ncbi:MAG: MBL fold metallo-hydrolase, partial [Candidatus Eisenbacteria bacterium]|nr:MBL fold metallo-hydrolase [Candidatus Eisenbacteria bacterium]
MPSPTDSRHTIWVLPWAAVALFTGITLAEIVWKPPARGWPQDESCRSGEERTRFRRPGGDGQAEEERSSLRGGIELRAAEEERAWLRGGIDWEAAEETRTRLRSESPPESSGRMRPRFRGIAGVLFSASIAGVLLSTSILGVLLPPGRAAGSRKIRFALPVTLLALVALLTILILGFLHAGHRQRRWEAESAALASRAHDFTWTQGVITGRAREGRYGFTARCRLYDTPGRPQVWLRWDEPWRPLPGDAWCGFIRLKPLRPPSAPGTIDPRRRARRDGVSGIAAARVLYSDRHRPVPPGLWIPRATTAAGDRIERTLRSRLSSPSWRFLAAFLLGRREHLDPERVAAFRETGTAHLLAISGLHVGFVALAISPLMGLAGRRRPVRILALGLALGAFAALTGAAPPVCRAGLMIVSHQIGILRGSRNGGLAGWCLGLMGEAWIRPAGVLTPGFTLSYGAALGLLLAARRGWLRPLAPSAPGILRRLKLHMLLRPLDGAFQIVRASAVVLIVTGPLLAAYFGRWLPLSILHNVLLIPAAGFTLNTALAGLALSWIPGPPGLAAAVCVDVATRGFLHLQELSRSLIPEGLVAIACPLTVALLLAAALALSLLKRRWSLWSMFAAALSLILLASAPDLVRRQSPWTATFFSLGRGEAILLSWPGGGPWLVDTGPGGMRGGEPPILRVLESVPRIDTVVITHDQWDHDGALADLCRQIPVRRILAAPGAAGLLSERLPDECVVEAVRGFSEEPARGVTVTVLHPVSGDSFTGNNGSLVLHAAGWGMSLLLTGDLEHEGEEFLCERGAPRAALLKLGHHGRATSTGERLLQAVRPECAVTLGTASGEQRAEVLLRLQETGVVSVVGEEVGPMRLETAGRRWRLRPLASRGRIDLGAVAEPESAARRRPHRSR